MSILGKIVSHVAGAIAGLITGIVTGPVGIIKKSAEEEGGRLSGDLKVGHGLLTLLGVYSVWGALYGCYRGARYGFEAGVAGALHSDMQLTSEKVQELRDAREKRDERAEKRLGHKEVDCYRRMAEAEHQQRSEKHKKPEGRRPSSSSSSAAGVRSSCLFPPAHGDSHTASRTLTSSTIQTLPKSKQ